MPKPKLNRSREQRIIDEIVVDAYNETERAMGWYHYLEEKLAFPFKARCSVTRSVSPLKKGEEVEVIALAKEDDCMREVFVLIRFAGRKLGVPSSQFEVSEAKSEMRAVSYACSIITALSVSFIWKRSFAQSTAGLQGG